LSGGAEYDAVRRKLQERGYLDGRIERFVLRRGGVSHAGVRAALLGGPLLGALLAGVVVAANRPLLAARDGLVLWAYFSVLAGVALFVLDLGAALLAAAAARRRGPRAADSLRASLLVGAPVLAYAALLWWRRPTRAALWEDLLFFAVALAATAAVAWLAGLVSLAGILGRTGEVPDRARRPLLALTLVLVALAAAGALARGALGSAPVAAPPVFEPAPAGPLLVVGVDGLDGDLLERLAATGAVDGILARFAAGAVLPLVRRPGVEPAEVWTTLMTGMPADAHGVRAAGASHLPGVQTPLAPPAGGVTLGTALRLVLPLRTVPTSGAHRRVLALWEIVGLKDPVAAVGWWASWPADAPEHGGPRGYVVTDRVLAKLLARRPGDRDTSPASLFDRLDAGFEAERARLRAEFATLFGGLRDEALERLAWESFLIDGYHAAALELLRGDPAVRTAFVYLPGLDILRRRTDAAPVVESYVRWLDGRVAALASPSPGGHVLLIGDAGRSATASSEGFLAVLGPAAEPGCIGTPVTPLDAAPTALALLGYPLSREMPGRLPAVCVAAPAGAPPAVAGYGRKVLPARTPQSDYDPEMVERLRSLGYVR
jgi:hypothetical protein